MKVGSYNSYNYYDNYIQKDKNIDISDVKNIYENQDEDIKLEEKNTDNKEAEEKKTFNNINKETIKDESVQDEINRREEEGKKLISEMNKLGKIFDEEDDSECKTVTEKVVKELKRKQKAEKIASKVARGENITESERRYLQQKHPELLDKSYKINRARKEAEMKIRSAKTKEEARQIIMNARQSGIIISMTSIHDKIGESQSVGKVIGAAVDKLDTDTKADVKKKEKRELFKMAQKNRNKKRINKLI